MLQIAVPLSQEGWDEEKQEFVEPVYFTLQLEHSLVSISKWESKWCKSFLSNPNKTEEEVTDYIRCMTITQNVKPDIYARLSADNIKEINEYIGAPMTATYFSEDGSKKGVRESVTSELIYYWMIALNIPMQCEKWHLNRLLTLIRVCNIKNAPPKKRSRKDILSRNAALNQARKQKLNTKG
jgi:hypothetical protein